MSDSRVVRRGMGLLASTVAVVAVAGSLGMGVSEARSDEPRRSVSPEALARALAEEAPTRRSQSDEIAYFEGRLARVGDEPFSLQRIHSAHLLRYRAYGDAHDLDAAVRYLARLEELDAGRAGSLKAQLHLTRHDFAAAVEVAEAMAGGTVVDEASAFRLFDVLWAVGRRAEATEALDWVTDTGSLGYRARRARVLDANGSVEGARDLFRGVAADAHAWAEAAPVRAWALVELGHFELHSGDADRAVERYLDALDVLPGSPAAIEGLASVAYGVDRDASAAADLYRRALALGGHLDIMPLLAEIERELGRDEIAHRIEHDFVEAATATDDAERMARLPLILLLAEEREQRCVAVEMAREEAAIRQDPQTMAAVAWALYRSGRVEEAWAAASVTVASGSPEPAVAYVAGVVAAASGRHDDARTWLGEALDGSIELTTAEVAEARRILDGGTVEVGARSCAR